MSAEFVACMEDVLDLWNPIPKRPVVCFDGKHGKEVSDEPARRGDTVEYQRNGTRNLFMLCEPLAWRHVA